MPLTKIASSQELQQRLTDLLTYVTGPRRPSRQRIARELRGLATGLLSSRIARPVTAAMSESEFWKIIEPYRWGRGNTNYKEIEKDLMRKLTPKEADALQSAFAKLKGQADRALGDYFEEQGEWVGGDSWDDFLSHIIGMGKQEYEADLKDKDRALARFRKGDYRESFAYALPTSHSYERLDLGKYIKWAQKEVNAYREILGASEDDIPWKNKLAPDLKKLVDILDDFIRTKDFGAFLDKEDEAKRAAQDVEQVLRRLSGSGLDGSLGEAVDFARNKWGVWNLFTDVRQYLG